MMPSQIFSEPRDIGRRHAGSAVASAVAMTALTFLLVPAVEQVRSTSPAFRLASDFVLMPTPSSPVLPPVPAPPPPAPPPRSPPLPLPRLEEERRPSSVSGIPDFHVALNNLDGVVRAGRFDIRLAHVYGPERKAAPEVLFDMSDLDRPPQPLVRLLPPYPPRAQFQRLEGTVTVEFVVTAEGTTRDGVVIDAEPRGIFEKAVLRAVRNWRFAPGWRAGKPVAVRVRQTVRFQFE